MSRGREQKCQGTHHWRISFTAGQRTRLFCQLRSGERSLFWLAAAVAAFCTGPLHTTLPGRAKFIELSLRSARWCSTSGGFHHPSAPRCFRVYCGADEFTRLIGKRLRKDPYRDCYALDGWGKKGAIGSLFKLELAPYGYTFVGKGTGPHHLDHLRHECRV